MSKAKTKNRFRRIVDAAMTVLLLGLMAYQVTGEVLHEWIGIRCHSAGVSQLVGIHPDADRFFSGGI